MLFHSLLVNSRPDGRYAHAAFGSPFATSFEDRWHRQVIDHQVEEHSFTATLKPGGELPLNENGGPCCVSGLPPSLVYRCPKLEAFRVSCFVSYRKRL
jgi:hypothetical protein